MTSAAVTLQVSLTDQQQREFTACAEACGLELVTWLVQCASVQAAAVIDAVQATQRKRRKQELAANEPANSQSRERRRARERTGPAKAPTESATLEAARSYNARFRARRP